MIWCFYSQLKFPNELVFVLKTYSSAICQTVTEMTAVHMTEMTGFNSD